MIYDAVVVGAGFFGIRVGLILAAHKIKTLIIEKNSAAFTRSSLKNQARIHNGYHYPRNYPTASSSHRNYSKFIQEYQACIYDDFQNIYAIASNSYTNAYQFKSFCDRLGLPSREASRDIRGLFNQDMIEQVFVTDEKVFNTNKLREKLINDLNSASDYLTLATGAELCKIHEDNDTYLLEILDQPSIKTKQIFNVSYAGINHVLKSSNFELIDLKLEIAEICLVDVPNQLKHLGITVMDGPFFSLMPFPAGSCHSLSHVRYTPHNEWRELENCFDPYKYLSNLTTTTNYIYMQKDAVRYVPVMDSLEYKDSFRTIKAITCRNETDDGRPIVFKKHKNNFYSILGTKFDNIYDLEIKIEEVL